MRRLSFSSPNATPKMKPPKCKFRESSPLKVDPYSSINHRSSPSLSTTAVHPSSVSYLKRRRSCIAVHKMKYASTEANATMEERNLSPQDVIFCPRSDCRAPLSNVWALQYHLELHDIETDGCEPRYSCNSCRRKYETRRERDMHICAPTHSRNAQYRPLETVLYLISRLSVF